MSVYPSSFKPRSFVMAPPEPKYSHVTQVGQDPPLKKVLREWEILADEKNSVHETVILQDCLRSSRDAIEALAHSVPGASRVHTSYPAYEFPPKDDCDSTALGIAVQLIDHNFFIHSNSPLFYLREYSFLAALVVNPDRTDDVKGIKVDLVKFVFERASWPKNNNKGVVVRIYDDYDRSFYEELGFEKVNDHYMKADCDAHMNWPGSLH